MKTILLLAGRSTRFWPLSEKTMFPICGKAILEHQIDRLLDGGCSDIILVGGAHNLEEAQTLFPDLPVVEQEDLNLGMRGAVLSVLPNIGDEPVLVVSGNDVIEPSAYRSLTESESNAILAQKVDRYFPGGYLSTNGDQITGIVEKPGEGNEPSDLVNIVAHVHRDPKALLDALQHVDESRDDGYEQALATLFVSHKYKVIPYEGGWQAVKYPWHLLSLLPVLLPERAKPVIHKTATIHPTAVIDGPVVIDENVKVMPHAVIRGPCYIGPNSIVANNALVRDSSVGRDCVVGYNTEVKGSILHSHVWTHMGYVGDSVIGRNVCFGGGSITANFRLDEQTISSVVNEEPIDSGLTKLGTIVGDDCRLGIQVGIGPGVKIGSGTFISSGSQVNKDIHNRQFARMKEGVLQVSDNRSEAPDPTGREQYRRGVDGDK